MKRTKILATLGPSARTNDTIRALHEAGADAFRINMSHGTPDQWRALIRAVRSVAPAAAVVMDTKGPELRIIGIAEPLALEAGASFTFALGKQDGMAYLTHAITLAPGQKVLFDDGSISTTVESVTDSQVTVRVKHPGTLTDRRKVTVPDDSVELPVIDEADKADLALCKQEKVDAIALSFTQSAADVRACRGIVGPDIRVIAKIENGLAVERHDEIVQAADGIMIARGDLGVEIPMEEVPLVQKRLCRVANHAAKVVVVATQMLESMTYAAVPTRAEVSDVANAIIDGADCLMLSGETARGEHPLEVVRTMARIASKTDNTLIADHRHASDTNDSIAGAVSAAVYELASNVDVDAIITATASGFTARMVARFRPLAPIVGVAHSVPAKRWMQLSWGVTPCLFIEESGVAHHTIVDAVRSALAEGLVHEDDRIIATAGVDTKRPGSTNLIEVHVVKDLLSYHEKG